MADVGHGKGLGFGFARANDPRHVFESPSRRPPGAPASRVQFHRDPPQRATPRAQVPDRREHSLLLRIGLQVRAVRREPETIRDVPDALAIRLLVAHRITRPFADSFALPLRDRGHNIDDQPTRRRAGVERLRDRNQRHLAFLEELQEAAEVFHAASQPEFGDYDRVHNGRWYRASPYA
jgi:hypothetical protein